MSYLGYKHKNETSVLASRLTLKLNKEIELYFFDETTFDQNGKEYSLQGFTISRYNISKEDAYELTKDLKCIYINERDSNSSETLFIIAPDSETVQVWYDMMREGSISMRILRKFGEMLDRGTKESITIFRQELEKTTPINVVLKQV